jgi:hypothetical protein
MSQFDTKQVPMEVAVEKGASEFIEDAPVANDSGQDNVLRDAELMAGESQEKVTSLISCQNFRMYSLARSSASLVVGFRTILSVYGCD